MMSSKKMSFILLSLLVSYCNIARDFTPAVSESQVKFSIKNFGIATSGLFTGLKGRIKFNPANLNDCSFNMSVDAASVNTGIKARDNHLRKEDYFNVNLFPYITFVSETIAQTEKQGIYVVRGILTVKGVAKEISFTFTASQNSYTYLFKGDFELDRKDFGVGGSSVTLSNNVKVSLSVYAKPF